MSFPGQPSLSCLTRVVSWSAVPLLRCGCCCSPRCADQGRRRSHRCRDARLRPTKHPRGYPSQVWLGPHILRLAVHLRSIQQELFRGGRRCENRIRTGNSLIAWIIIQQELFRGGRRCENRIRTGNSLIAWIINRFSRTCSGSFNCLDNKSIFSHLQWEL